MARYAKQALGIGFSNALVIGVGFLLFNPEASFAGPLERTLEAVSYLWTLFSFAPAMVGAFLALWALFHRERARCAIPALAFNVALLPACGAFWHRAWPMISGV
jgi:hypothetical protein